MEHSKEYDELKKSLTGIARFIKKGRKDLATSTPEEIVEKYIPDSTLELKAIITDAERASNNIMDSCDAIEAIAGELDEDQKQIILAETAKIYAACGFQDLTGQRATKVISYLAQVEEKTIILIKNLKDFFDKEGTLADEYQQEEAEDDGEISDEDLMNGPQLEGQGLTQAEVDAMLNDF